jgi:hypothetical protein
MSGDRTYTIDWLLQSDPSIRWQVQKDLLEMDKSVWEEVRRRIAQEGWGKALLDLRQPDGRWGGGWYSPKWISTHYTLMLLRRMGLCPDNHQACESILLLLEKGCYHDGGINLFATFDHSETCVTGMILSLSSYFNIPLEKFRTLIDFLLDQQMEDGGWNCESFRGARHSSMHTTISVLEGLWEFEKKYDQNKDHIRQARRKAHEFLFIHRLFKSDTTGEIIDPKWTRLSFPPRWRYDILRVLDYFQDCSGEKDDRMTEAIDILLTKEKNGCWPLQSKHAGRVFFEMEKPGLPSRWNTLRSLRVLNWWERKRDKKDF